MKNQYIKFYGDNIIVEVPGNNMKEAKKTLLKKLNLLENSIVYMKGIMKKPSFYVPMEQFLSNNY